MLKGRFRYIYVNTGTVESPTWTIINKSGDINNPRTTGEIVDTTREMAQKNVATVDHGLQTDEISFDMFRPAPSEAADTAYDALEDAYNDQSEIELLLADAAISGSSVKSRKITCKLFDFSEVDGLEGEATVSVRAKNSATEEPLEGTCTSSVFTEAS